MSAIAIAAIALATWIHPALAVNWVELVNGWAYDKDSVKLGPSGGELIFRVRQERAMIFRTSCDGYAEWAQLAVTGTARELIFSKTRQKMAPGTMVAFLYGRICE